MMNVSLVPLAGHIKGQEVPFLCDSHQNAMVETHRSFFLGGGGSLYGFVGDRKPRLCLLTMKIENRFSPRERTNFPVLPFVVPLFS